MIPYIILKINVFTSIAVPAKTWVLCNSNEALPEHIQEACNGIAQAILQALSWSM